MHASEFGIVVAMPRGLNKTTILNFPGKALNNMDIIVWG